MSIPQLCFDLLQSESNYGQNGSLGIFFFFHFCSILIIDCWDLKLVEKPDGAVRT